jgi:lipopolysaccharide transport system ATP-binding protein
MDAAIRVENLSKTYRRYDRDRPPTLQEAVLRGLRRLGPRERVYALRALSFAVAPGEMIGIIGRNGAGKSTLLRLLGGVGRPDHGTIQVNGRIGALLDLGAGFHPDLTGRENVYISGVISGLTRRQVSERFDSIVAFAELEEFIDSPLRTYSSGMQMRLAFAVAVHIEADVLLIDEVLAVGDAAFQRKCLERIARFTQEGYTGVLVSHDLSLVAELCNQVLWIEKGERMAYGPADLVVAQYLEQTRTRTEQLTPSVHSARRLHNGALLEIYHNRFGSLEVEIEDLFLRDANGLITDKIQSGDPLQIEIAYQSTLPVASPIFEIIIKREDGVACFKSNTAAADLALPTGTGRGALTIDIARLDLAPGLYSVDVGVYPQDWSYAYDYHWQVYPLTVEPSMGRIHTGGIIDPPSRWRVAEASQCASQQEVKPIHALN